MRPPWQPWSLQMGMAVGRWTGQHNRVACQGRQQKQRPACDNALLALFYVCVPAPWPLAVPCRPQAPTHFSLQVAHDPGYASQILAGRSPVALITAHLILLAEGGQRRLLHCGP